MNLKNQFYTIKNIWKISLNEWHVDFENTQPPSSSLLVS